MLDSLARGAEFADIVRGYVDRATAPLLVRIAELEKRPTAEVVEAQIERALRAAVEALPKPADGKDGKDGVDGEPGEKGEPGRDADPAAFGDIVRAVEEVLSPEEGKLNPVAVEVSRWLEANPPAAGADGAPGEKGSPGSDGRDGKDAEPVSEETVAAATAKWLEANPPAPGADGRDGADGKDGGNGRDGTDGQKGEPGRDGAGLAGAMFDRDGCLIITLTNGETRNLGPAVGRDGVDGKDGARGDPGRDGFALADFEVEQRDLRTLILSFTSGETKQSYEVALGGFVDRGGFKAGKTYELGDTVTWGGELWIAQGPTSEKPGGNDDWRLAVRKGRDGKDGQPGKDGEKGAPGNPGRDGKSWG